MPKQNCGGREIKSLKILIYFNHAHLVQEPNIKNLKKCIINLPRRHFWDSRGSGSRLSVPENSDFGSDQGPTWVPVWNCKHRQCWLDHSWYWLGITRPWIKTETKTKFLIGFQLRENWDPRVPNELGSLRVKVRTMSSGMSQTALPHFSLCLKGE